MSEYGVHLSLVNDKISCPVCGHVYLTEIFYEKLEKSKKEILRFKCKECGEKINYTTGLKAEIVMWKEK